jgi:membrane protein
MTLPRRTSSSGSTWLVADPTTVRDQIESLAKLLSPETADLVGKQLVQVTSGANGALGLATVVGILTALWSASSGMKALITGVNLAYDETESRKFVKLRGLALLLTLGAMLLVGVALATIIGYPPIADTLPTALRWLVAIVRFVILGGLLVVGLAVLYRYAPDRDQPKWSWVSWGRGSPPCCGCWPRSGSPCMPTSSATTTRPTGPWPGSSS